MPALSSAATPLAAYNFDAKSGVALADSSGNNFNGTLTNGPVWSSGKYSGGLAFDGANDYVSMGDVGAADGTSQFTVSTWVKFAANGGGGNETHLVDKSRCSGEPRGGPWELGVSLTRSHKAEFLIYPQSGSPAYVFSGASVTSVDDGAWHYVTGRYDGVNLSLWVDGVQEASRALARVTMASTANRVELGGRCNGYSYPFKGALDDVRIYNKALTQSEILADMATPVGGGAQSPGGGTPPPVPTDVTAPSKPAVLSASGITTSRIVVSWQASTDNVAVTGYRVYRNGTSVGTTSATSYTHTGLAANSTYIFTVAAFDGAGNTSAESNALSANTAASTAPPPTTPPPTTPPPTTPPPTPPPEETTPPVSSSGTYTTNFDATANPISEGGVWRRAGNQWTNVQTVGGVAFGTNGVTNGYDDSYALLSGFAPDQTAEAVVYRDTALSPGSTHEVELLLRFSDDANNARGYECLFSWDGSYQIARWNGPFGNVSMLSLSDTGYFGRPLKTGDIVKATIAGNVIRIYINGVQMARAVDSTFASGQPGVAFFIRPDGSQRLLGLTSYKVTSP